MTDQDFERKEKARLDAMFDAQFADEPTQETDYADEPQVNGWPLYSGLPKTDKQPEALRLADALLETVPKINDWNEAAAELRRLHSVNVELRLSLRRILDEPNNTMSDGKALKEIIRIARMTINKTVGENND